MREKSKKSAVANILATVAANMLSSAANSRCMFCFHQPKQSEQVKKFRKF